jgi:hypothetical protein
VDLSHLHLLSDFDGVWTEPTREMQAVHDTVVGELARMGDFSQVEMEEIYAGFAQAIMRHPQDHGWRIEGKMSSFVDEDYFAMPTAVGQHIDLAPCSRSSLLRQRILQEWPQVIEFLDYCYHSTCDRFRALHKHDLAHGADRVLGWLLERGVSIVFATNAPAEKVIDWFAHQGYEVADARQTSRSDTPLRVYGRAGKQILGSSGQALDFCGRTVQIDRPQYREILQQECADAVIGDVLSLDLSLPLAMRQQGDPAAPKAIGLMHMRHTPQWALQSIGPDPVQIDWLVSHITALPRLLATLARPLIPAPL